MGLQWENIISHHSLPTNIKNILGQNLLNPPKVATKGFPLYQYEIDHFAIALSDVSELRRLWATMTADPEIKTIEPVHLWPEGLPGCPQVEEIDKKWMTTLGFDTFSLVLLAPHRADDLIGKFLKRVGKPDVHHIAYIVRNFDDKVEELKRLKGIVQITPIAEDKNTLKQVFFKYPNDERIIELIHRADTFFGTFTCKNIQTLTQGERKNLSDGKFNTRIHHNRKRL